jgi:hypothetical protein
MKDNKMTVKLWAEIAEVATIDDDRAENLNGGSGYFNLYVNGGIGSVQQNGNDGVQINVLPKGYAAKRYGW